MPIRKRLRDSVGVCILLAATAADGSPLVHARSNYPTQVFWGDTHLHTNLSADAFAMGIALTPDDAYRFARGQLVKGRGGTPLQLSRPLDFLVIADHAENLGVLPALEAGDPLLLATRSGALWHEKMRKALPALARLRKLESITDQSVNELRAAMHDGASVVGSPEFRGSVWKAVANRADRYNDPGKFTAFSGYEWTATTLSIHRVLVFKDDADTVSQMLPFSQLDSTRPEDLWAHLERYISKTGGDVIAIPHNPNMSSGHMFLTEDSYGRKFSRDYARMRSRWEPLLEVTQSKGDSETHPELSPNDEFANYERLKNYWTDTTDRGRRYEYARSALQLGLDQQAATGANPFKFGMIGSTDSHSALSAVEAEKFWALHPYPPSQITTPYTIPSTGEKPFFLGQLTVAGYAAIWAQANTRAALFEAMKRREVYATTGSRIELRFFGGWSFQPEDALERDFAAVGYAKGVPMGGDLTHPPKGRIPSFLIRAVKDPRGANLDRVQVIKGWRDAQGKLREKIYNVALSDGREEAADGRVPAVGSTVNIQEATYTNDIGDSELAVVWRDPAFDARELAFYYARVIEIPTPRWTAHYAKSLAVEQMPAEIPMVSQHRAYSSPIWYTP